MKVSLIALLAFACALCGVGQAEAYVGYGYRANDPVKVARCYRGFAYDYAAPFYQYGASRGLYARKGCCCKR